MPVPPAWTPDAVHVWWHATPAGETAPQARRGRLDRLLRAVLARYTGGDPAALRFARESKGRPYLADGGPDFNLSDTVGGTVVAVANAGRLGVDLERTDFAIGSRGRSDLRPFASVPARQVCNRGIARHRETASRYQVAAE